MKRISNTILKAPTLLWPNLARDLFLNKISGSIFVPDLIRWRLLNAFGLNIQKSRICPEVWFGSKNISIGEGTFINYGCRFNTAGGISIGRACDIAPRVMFITSTHLQGSPSRRAGSSIAEEIKVGDGVWIGAGAIILPGVKIGSGCIIAAGAVVNRDCADNTLYAGNPAVAKKLII